MHVASVKMMSKLVHGFKQIEGGEAALFVVEK